MEETFKIIDNMQEEDGKIMRISDLINHLKELQKIYGDAPIFNDDGYAPDIEYDIDAHCIIIND